MSDSKLPTYLVRMTHADFLHREPQSEAYGREVFIAYRRDHLMRYLDLTERQADLVARVVDEASHNGLITWTPRRIEFCPVCGGSGGFAPYKRDTRGGRKGEPNLAKPRTLPGVDFAQRFVRAEGHATLGCCLGCADKLVDTLRNELRDVRAQLPERLVAEGCPTYRRYDKRHCTACGWRGNEGQMGRLPTLMPGGTYPGKCPSCGAENRPLGSEIIEPVEGFEVVAVERPELPSRSRYA